MKLEVLICTYERPEISSKYIPLVHEMLVNDGMDFELVLFDNRGANEQTREFLRKFQTKKNTSVIFNPQNIGKLGALVCRARDTNSDFILELDDDCIYPANLASRIVSAYSSYKEKVPNLGFLGWDISWSGGKSYVSLAIERSKKNGYQYDLIGASEHQPKAIVFGSSFPYIVPGCCRVAPVSVISNIDFSSLIVKYGSDLLIARSANAKGYVNALSVAGDDKDLIRHMGSIEEKSEYKTHKGNLLNEIVKERKSIVDALPRNDIKKKLPMKRIAT